MIREITKRDFDAFWPSFKSIIQSMETYAFDPNMDLEKAYYVWCEEPLNTFVFEVDEKIFGSYYIKPNGNGPGSHVCNCGYMVPEFARGRGIARELCIHSQEVAVQLGFKSMQFNSVASSNVVALRLWRKLGFEVIGTAPNAFRHPRLGYIDSHIMYKQLVK
ncbi:RimJ/RimL family protein N-acetyltransferase [Natronospira proteinivora]|uniref:RimJ/RimL family protein N-acetyltransferase n=1 Tax=Natronospira proteinivora TaxID=1807133 RepID=A0ABT1G6L1_9GAMM|nr:GNAT family N-acetyltransferase [Natronospira proteinivora]MCP1726595.1 RimJ/RimL family protein N-acetyltransferase [Natronospira proteinivora]